MPETSTPAKRALQEEYQRWQPVWRCCGMHDGFTGIGKEWWVIVPPHARLLAAKEHMKKTQDDWEKKLWHLSVRPFSCENDAEVAWKQAMKGIPSWLVTTFTLRSEAYYQQRGKPKKDASLDKLAWHLMPTVSIDEPEVEVQIKKDACFIIATNMLDEQELSHEQVITTYKEQGGVERGFRFLKDPLFLASSIFGKSPERVVALSFIMVLCLLVYRKASHLLRSQLAATEQTIPNQVNKPTNRPIMRWIFQCFEGIDLLHIRIGSRFQTQVLGLQALHQLVLRLLSPTYSQCYFFSP